MTKKLLDLTGKTFGKLTAIKRLENMKWLCRCECGEVREVSVSSLNSGNSRSCGCSRAARNLRGKKFGKLAAIKSLGASMWLCACECGNEKEINGSKLFNGKTRSCGCLLRDDLRGKKFGRLTAVEYLGVSEWLCTCECGNKKKIRARFLKEGRSRSCGCIKRSIGELRIAHILDSLEIQYEEQATFHACRDMNLLPFDFCIHHAKILIEYQGQHHFQVTGGWNDESHFKGVQRRDEIKREWARNNGYALVAIHHKDYERILEILTDALQDFTGKEHYKQGVLL